MDLVLILNSILFVCRMSTCFGIGTNLLGQFLDTFTSNDDATINELLILCREWGNVLKNSIQGEA